MFLVAVIVALIVFVIVLLTTRPARVTGVWVADDKQFLSSAGLSSMVMFLDTDHGCPSIARHSGAIVVDGNELYPFELSYPKTVTDRRIYVCSSDCPLWPDRFIMTLDSNGVMSISAEDTLYAYFTRDNVSSNAIADIDN